MNQNVHLRLVVIDVARSRMMQIIIDQRRHSRNVVHRWVVYIIILHHPYGSDRCYSKMRSEVNEMKQNEEKKKRERKEKEERGAEWMREIAS